MVRPRSDFRTRSASRRAVSGVVARLAACALAWVACSPERAPSPLPSVVMISLDGTTPEAARSADMPALDALAARGASAELRPVFPTNTFPNHVTLVTGVQPEVHGIVANSFVDPERGVFHYENEPGWIEVEPLWALLDRHGVVSASFHWVGSQGPWRNGHGPRHWRPFDASTPEAQKVEQILAWLALSEPAERPRLVTAWFPGADAAAHRFGPDAPEVAASLGAQDVSLARLAAGLEARGAFAHTTLLIVSDHGMAPVTRQVDLHAALAAAGIDARAFGGGGVANVALADARDAPRAAAVAAALGLEVHSPRSPPPDLRLAHPRFGDLVAIAPPGVAIARAEAGRPAMRGAHGYRPEVPGMGALFVAAGQGVPAGARLGSVRAIDVAPTILSLLGVPAPDWMEGRPIAALVPGSRAGAADVPRAGGAR